MAEDETSLSSSAITNQLKDLTTVVDTLSKKLDDYIDNNSTYSRSIGTGQPWNSLGNVANATKQENIYNTAESMPRKHSKGKVDYSKDENEKRGNWSGRIDFVLSCLGYAVGLGNVWRFPYKVYENGGGAFFIAYTIMLFLIGIPVFYLELSLGQYTSSGPLTCWNFAPILKGIGWSMLIVSSFTGIYYNIVMAWAFYFFGVSFQSQMPWQTCDGSWNTKYCYNKIPDVNCSEEHFPELSKEMNGTCYNTSDTSRMSPIGLWNVTLAKAAGITRRSAAEEYYFFNILGVSSGFGDLGEIKWQLALCLLASWVVVYICLCKGVKTSGKAVYFTALFPYAVLIALFIRGLTLEGYSKGIMFYVTPDWERLKDAKVWNDAAIQIFFSLGCGFGGLIALSSYNRFNNNCLRDALIVTFGNCLTSFFAGFVVFSYLGYLAHTLNSDVKDVVSSGFGLVFVVYPEAISKMPFPPVWAVLFFLMLITLGLDTQFANIEMITTSVMDRWPKTLTRKTKPLVMLVLCVTFYIIGLVFCTNGALHILELLDAYVGGWSILLIAFLECFGLLWMYGWKRWKRDLRIMLGRQPFIWWRLSWEVFTPLVILFVLFFAWADYRMPSSLPFYANIIGWVLVMCVVLPIPIFAIIVVLRAEGKGFSKKFQNSIKPNKKWGPALVQHRKLVNYIQGFVVNPYIATPTKQVHVRNHQHENRAFEEENP